MRGHLHVGEEPVHREGPELADVGAGEDGHDTGRRPRGRYVEPANARECVSRPQEGHVYEPGRVEIVDVATDAGEESPVLDPLERPADVPRLARLRHGRQS
jgi:hypothetical protein